MTKKRLLTKGEMELLTSLNEGCNIALYRSGQVRLRDAKHNPIRNVSSTIFNEIRDLLVQREGLFYIADAGKEFFKSKY